MARTNPLAAEEWGFILGAGASKGAGYPLVNDLLSPRYLRQLVAEIKEPFGPKQAELMDEWGVWLDRECEFFTSFGAPDFEQLLSRFVTKEDDESVRRLERYLGAVLGMARDRGSHYDIWKPVYDFCLVLTRWIPHVTLISFNYDLLFDWALKLLEIPAKIPLLHYGFGPEEQRDTSDQDHCLWMTATNPVSPPYLGSIPLLKLHGSLNWSRCQRCGTLTIFRTEIGDPYLPALDAKKCQECGEVAERPFIVPPSPEKQVPKLLEPLWRRAEGRIQRADVLVFVGYSLPEYDMRSYELFQQACSPVALNLKRVYAVAPSIDDRLRSRYETLSPSVQFYAQSFEDYIKDEMALFWERMQ